MRLYRDTRAAVAVEFGLIVCALFVPCLYGAEQLGPVLLAWENNLSAQIMLAHQLCTALGGSCP